jgi:hypothetical protein
MAAQVEAARPAGSAATILQSQRKPGDTDRVVVSLEAGGETNYTADGKPQHEKIGIQCHLDYLERTMESPADGIRRAVRDYQKVEATVSIGDGQFRPALERRHHLIAVEAGKQSALLFSPLGSLTRDELDAIDVQANSLLFDRLLPDTAGRPGDRWSHSPELMAALLGLDEVAKSTVQSTLKEVAGDAVRMEIAGQVEGAIYGVATKIEIQGRYRFRRQARRIDWLGLLIKEDRPGSFVDDGMSVVSRLQVSITPVEPPASLADAALAKLRLEPDPELASLAYRSPNGDWQCRHDRRWCIYRQGVKTSVAVLRLMDRGTLVAQCNLASLADHAPGKLVSLAEFQEDVRRALDKSFGQFVEASASSPGAYRVYRVVVDGTASDLPMQWIYYLVAEPEGRQAALTFTVEQKLAERFADADKPIVQSLRFAAAKDAKKEQAAGAPAAEKR